MKPTHNRMTPYHSPQAQPLTRLTVDPPLCEDCQLILTLTETMRGNVCCECQYMREHPTDEFDEPVGICDGGQNRDSGDTYRDGETLLMTVLLMCAASVLILAGLGVCHLIELLKH